VWSGSVNTTDAYFIGVKGTPRAQATATIVLKPKVGYTFSGTDLVVADFVAASAVPFTAGLKAGSTLTGDKEGNLTLTVVYNIDEKTILSNELIPDNFTTRIARPLDGKSVGVGTPNAVSTAFTAKNDSPYTGTVSWSLGSAPRALGKFDISEAPTATITLTPKAGYKFYTAGPYSNNAVLRATAVDGPNTSGNATVVDAYTLTATIPYSTGTIKRQIRNLDGLHYDDIDPVVDGNTTALATETTSDTGSPIEDSSGTPNIFAQTGFLLIGSDNYFKYNTPGTVKIALKPDTSSGYSFFADDGPLPYLTYSGSSPTDDAGKAIKALIEGHFSKVYDGTTVPANARVESVEAPYLDASGNLVLTLKFPAKPQVIDEGNFTILTLGDLPGIAPPADGDDRPTALTGGGNGAFFTASDIDWTTDDPADAGKFVTGKNYTATIELTPKTGYTFVGSPLDDIDDALDGSSTGIWRTGGGANIALGDTAITVTGVTVMPGTIAVDPDDDKLVIKLTWIIP
jgi:hypothetical protein